MAFSLNSFPGDTWLDALHERVGTRPTVLAQPPAGSGLAPVMGEQGLPLIGKTLEILRQGQARSIQYVERYGPVFWTGTFGQRMVWVVGPDAVKEVLTTKSKVYSQSGWEFFIGPFFHRGLMLLDGQEHLLHRRIMQEAFTRPRLASYLSQVLAVVHDEVPTWPVDEVMLLNPAIKKLSLGIATSVFMGADRHQSDHLAGAFVDTVRAGTGLVRRRVPGARFLRWNKGLAGRKVLEDHFRGQVPAKRASDDDDLFAALCHVETEDGHTFSDDDVVNHMIFLMMAAHDTSTITATTMAYHLAKDPALQERARAESQALAARTANAPVTLDSLAELTLLDRIFSESMRLVAPVPAFVRRATEDTDLLGRHVPAGTLVAVLPGSTHLVPEVWAEAETFDESRFDEPRREDRTHRFGSIPFGGGAHKCIGLVFGAAEVKALLHHLLLGHRIEVPADYEISWDTTSLVVPTDGLPVTLRRLAPPG